MCHSLNFGLVLVPFNRTFMKFYEQSSHFIELPVLKLLIATGEETE